jgi:hypothetical protein
MGADPVSPQTPGEPPTASVGGGPAEPSRPSWLRRSWKWFAGGVIGFIVGAVAGAGGESGTNTTTKTVASVKTVPRTVTQTKTNTKTVTKTQTAAQTTSGGTSSGGSAKSFRGNGGKNLGPLTVKDGETLQWTNDGDVFQIIATDSSGLPDILVNSSAHKGDTALTAASYKKFEVNAVGNWTIKISPSS